MTILTPQQKHKECIWDQDCESTAEYVHKTKIVLEDQKIYLTTSMVFFSSTFLTKSQGLYEK